MGAPVGNQNARKAKIWRDAIERALDHWPEKAPSVESRRGLHDAAYAFVAKMMESSDLGFFKELGDRMDGKPAQAIVGGDEDDSPVRVEGVIKLVRPSG